jgi:DNA-3-methyladenine glycosylase II
MESHLRVGLPAPPAWWPRAGRELSRADPVLARLVRRFRGHALRPRGDAFGTLARSIVGQQISVKAADAVWQRLTSAVAAVTPGDIVAAGEVGLAGCGLSVRKREYLIDLAAHVHDGRLHPRRWDAMADEAVIADLIRVRGIGRWTAQMFLIFSLCRPDVLPLDDIGLVRAMSLLCFDGHMPERPTLDARAECWRPWRSAATWYLWRSLDPVPVEY